MRLHTSISLDGVLRVKDRVVNLELFRSLMQSAGELGVEVELSLPSDSSETARISREVQDVLRRAGVAFRIRHRE